MNAKYDKVGIDECVTQQTHLNTQQMSDIKLLLQRHNGLFDRTVRVFPHKKVHIELEDNATPVHARAY